MRAKGSSEREVVQRGTELERAPNAGMVYGAKGEWERATEEVPEPMITLGTKPTTH